MSLPAHTADTPADKAARARALVSEPTRAEDVATGVQLAHEAAAEGDGDAMQLLAILASAGIGRAQDWEAAIRHLREAARHGSHAAQAELAVLNEGTGLAEGTGGIDLAPWFAPITAQRVSERPCIVVAPAFLPPLVCDWLIGLGRPHLHAAQTVDAATGAEQYQFTRTNRSAELSLGQSDVVLHLVRARMAHLCGLPTGAMEGSAILHYEPGQQFLRHYDFLEGGGSGIARQIALYGQRVATVLLYLNDDYEGGETEFPLLPWRYKGRKGDALYFLNVERSGAPDRRTLHAGLPPVQGEKWLLSQWVRDRVSRLHP
jgi:hypothetical protein